MAILSNFWDNLSFILSTLRWQDMVDVVLVWIIVYRVLVLIKRTGTVQMLSGLGIVAFSYIISIWFELYTLNWLLDKFFSNLFVIVVVLFQGEIRRALAHIGSHPFFSDASQGMETHTVEDVVKGISAIAQRGYGALIVIEREILVDYHIEVGTELEAQISPEIMVSIFHPQAPMHDGALIIRNGKIVAAGCFLPLSKNPALDKNLGTRHRAAFGLTEETDAIVFVVSEETNSISMVSNGVMKPNLEVNDIRKKLYEAYDLKYRPVSEVV